MLPFSKTSGHLPRDLLRRIEYAVIARAAIPKIPPTTPPTIAETEDECDDVLAVTFGVEDAPLVASTATSIRSRT